MLSAYRLLAVVVLTAASGVLVASSRGAPAPVAAQATLEVVVTGAGDGEANAADCPNDATCTLRAAILHVNADASAGTYVIRFDEDAFPAETPTIVALTSSALPPITRADVHVDGTGRGVIVDGSLLTGETEGLALDATGGQVTGIAFQSFTGACIAVRGSDATVSATSAGGCATGILLAGARAKARDNRVGFDTLGGPLPVATGIRVTAADAVVGAEGESASGGNTIGNAGAGIVIGDGSSGASFTGAQLARNTIGAAPGGDAEVSIGVQVLPPSSGATIRANTIENTTIAAIQVVTGSAEPGVTGNRLTGNRFAPSSGVTIDLGADNVRNPNDVGDADSGPNELQNHPEFTRPAQSAISGVVPGCDGCTVELYLAHHEPGGTDDYGTEPVPVRAATTDSQGAFSFVAPPVLPGAWITAIATDPEGNSSEFGPSARVGGGAAQCGNLTLHRGWNLVGFFFPTPQTLGAAFPAGNGTSRVSAIYHLDDGPGTYTRWFAGTTIGRTLTTLNPGESYWFFAEEETTLPSGFALSVPVPVQLKAGWNDFVYIGGGADIRDAFGSIAGKFSVAYRYTNDGDEEGWEQYAGPDVPGWVHDFTTVEACTTYFVHMDEAATLSPLQP